MSFSEVKDASEVAQVVGLEDGRSHDCEGACSCLPLGAVRCHADIDDGSSPALPGAVDKADVHEAGVPRDVHCVQEAVREVLGDEAGDGVGLAESVGGVSGKAQDAALPWFLSN